MATLTPTKNASLPSQIREFFYKEEVPYGPALVRIVMPLVLLVPTLQRWPFVRELYSADGSPAPLWETFGHPGMLPELPGSVAVAAYCAMIFFLIASSVGWFTRLSLVASLVLYTFFTMTDALGTVTKYTVIASHVLLLLSLSRCGAIWSVDAWLAGIRRNSWPGEPSVNWPQSAIWPRRLLQILIGVTYLGAAITKMHTPAFFGGDQLIFWMLSNWNFSNPVGEYLTLLPTLLVLFAYIAIIWEVLFLFLCWRGWGRVAMLSLGVTFHLMTTLILGLYIFPMVTITVYLSFVNEQDVARFARLGRRLRRRLRSAKPVAAPIVSRFRVPEWARLPAPAAFGLGLLGVIALGVQVEYLSDPYGLRRSEGPYALQEIDSDLVREMLKPADALREQDKFYAMDIGTTQVGGFLVDHRREFTQGERAIVEISLNTPHEDLWVECNLHDAENRTVDRVGQVVPREFSRAYANYTFTTAIEPGEYYIVLKSSGQEITRRKLVLHPVRVSAVAN